MTTMLLLEIDVTAEDVAEGCPEHAGLCPIARAAARAMQGQVMVTSSTLTVMRGPFRGFEWELPPSARAFVHRFDRRLTARPFRFALDPAEGRPVIV